MPTSNGILDFRRTSLELLPIPHPKNKCAPFGVHLVETSYSRTAMLKISGHFFKNECLLWINLSLVSQNEASQCQYTYP